MPTGLLALANEAVTTETEVRVEVGFIDHVVWRSRPWGLGGGGGAGDNIRACAMVRAAVEGSAAECRAWQQGGLASWSSCNALATWGPAGGKWGCQRRSKVVWPQAAAAAAAVVGAAAVCGVGTTPLLFDLP